MKRRWLALIGIVNIVGILYAAANQLVTIAILDPEKLQFDVNDIKSIKMAIARAESHGIEMMRSIQFGSVVVLAGLLILNFLFLALIAVQARKKSE